MNPNNMTILNHPEDADVMEIPKSISFNYDDDDDDDWDDDDDDDD